MKLTKGHKKVLGYMTLTDYYGRSAYYLLDEHDFLKDRKSTIDELVEDGYIKKEVGAWTGDWCYFKTGKNGK